MMKGHLKASTMPGQLSPYSFHIIIATDREKRKVL